MHTTPDRPTPAFSVVVCAYTEARWSEIEAALTSCLEQDHLAHEVILVVDHNEAMLERARRSFPGVDVTANVEQRGLSGARNSGLRRATGDIVAFMDDDAYADVGWLAALAEGYRDPEVMAVGGTIDPLWAAGRPRWFPLEFDWVVGCTYRGMPTTRAQVRNLIGCNMSFRKSVFDEVGGFVHGIGRLGTRPLGGEETELCIRALQRWPGRTILYEPSALVHHRVPAERGTWRYFRSRCYAEGLSKAAIARLVGGGDATSTERGYAVRVLGSAIIRETVGAVRRLDASALQRAVAIALGLAVTTVGFVVGSASIRQGHARLVGER